MPSSATQSLLQDIIDNIIKGIENLKQLTWLNSVPFGQRKECRTIPELPEIRIKYTGIQNISTKMLLPCCTQMWYIWHCALTSAYKPDNKYMERSRSRYHGSIHLH